MLKTAKLTLTSILAMAAIAVASGCGEDRSNLLPGDTADQIMSNLDQVEALADEGRCAEATEASGEVLEQVEALDQEVDPALRQTLLDGATQLVIIVQDTCVEADIEPDIEPAEPEAPLDEAPEEDAPETTTGQQGDRDEGGDDQGGEDGDDQGGEDGGEGGDQGGGEQGGGGEAPTPPDTDSPQDPGSGGVGPSAGGD